MNKHKSKKIKENSNTVRHLIMGQIITTQNLVAIKEVRHAGQSLKCSWSTVCRRCSNYIFILDLTRGFNPLGKDNCKTGLEIFKFRNLVRLILAVWWYFRFISPARGNHTVATMSTKVWANNHIDVLVQERCNSIALAMELRLSCTNPSICPSHIKT